MNAKRIHLPLVFLLAVTTASIGCTQKNNPPTQGSNMPSAHQKEIWTCPMHPQIKKDGPGTCPICGMNLQKASEVLNSIQVDSQNTHALPEGHAPIQLSETRRQMIGVKLGRVQKELLFKSIEASGRVAFDPELYTAQNEYLEAVRQLSRVQESPLADVKHSAERMVESAKLRLKILGLSDRQIHAIHESGSSGSSLLIPKPGENLWIYAEVYEMDLASVQPGLEASITGSALAGKSLVGKVISVDRVINPATRTAKVRISAPPEGKALLRPESYVNVVIRSPLGMQIAVPVDAVFDTGKEAWVFIADEKGTLVPQRVIIKFRTDDKIAIESGLKGQEQIVTSANFLIDSESRLKGTLLSPKKTPECPAGEEWHEQMGHCMKKVE